VKDLELLTSGDPQPGGDLASVRALQIYADLGAVHHPISSFFKKVRTIFHTERRKTGSGAPLLELS
jgi:hypothetical protein